MQQRNTVKDWAQEKANGPPESRPRALEDLHGRPAVDAGAAADGDEALDDVPQPARLQVVPEDARRAWVGQHVRVACSAPHRDSARP